MAGNFTHLRQKGANSDPFLKKSKVIIRCPRLFFYINKFMLSQGGNLEAYVKHDLKVTTLNLSFRVLYVRYSIEQSGCEA